MFNQRAASRPFFIPCRFPIAPRVMRHRKPGPRNSHHPPTNKGKRADRSLHKRRNR